MSKPQFKIIMIQDGKEVGQWIALHSLMVDFPSPVPLSETSALMGFEFKAKEMFFEPPKNVEQDQQSVV